MAIKDLKSIHDLVQGENAPVGDMENQKGPGNGFAIVDGTPLTLKRGFMDEAGVPTKSPLHAGPLEDRAGLSLVGPNYKHQYGGLTKPSTLDNNGVTPDQYLDKLPEGLDSDSIRG
jgi:hypothetical protein